MAANAEDEELRLKISNLSAAIRRAEALARNIILTNSPDPELWREDVQMLADTLERAQESAAYAWEVTQDGRTFLVSAAEFTRSTYDRGCFKPLFD